MRRRAQHRGPVVVPGWAARFDPAEWDDLGADDLESAAAAGRLAMARDRWLAARDAWARETGWSWVDEIRARRDGRLALIRQGTADE